MTYSLANLVRHYGYAALIVVISLEGIGLPVPGETLLVTAAALASRGHLSIVGVILSATAGTLIGGSGGYWVGRAGGLALLRRHGRLLHISEERLAGAHSFFQRHGAKTIFVARFVALLRVAVGILAGVGDMPFARFFVFNALGGAAWAVVFGTLGFLFGHNLPLLQRYGAQVTLLLTLLLALAVGLVMVFRRFDKSAEWSWRFERATWRRLASARVVQRLEGRYPRAWRFMQARFNPAEYLGLHLTMGMGVSLAALWVFGAITEDVVHHDPLTRLDMAIVTWFQGIATPAGLRIASALSLVGSPAAMAVLAVAVAAVLFLKRQRLVLAAWIAAFAGGSIVDSVLKVVIKRPRPPGAEAYLQGQSFSFPSGHALGSLVGYGMLVYVLSVYWVRGWPARVAMMVLALLLVSAIGLSRLYLGVHYLSDVAGGYAAGLLWLAACVSGAEVARRRTQSGRRGRGRSVEREGQADRRLGVTTDTGTRAAG